MNVLEIVGILLSTFSVALLIHYFYLASADIEKIDPFVNGDSSVWRKVTAWGYARLILMLTVWIFIIFSGLKFVFIWHPTSVITIWSRPLNLDNLFTAIIFLISLASLKVLFYPVKILELHKQCKIINEKYEDESRSKEHYETMCNAVLDMKSDPDSFKKMVGACMDRERECDNLELKKVYTKQRIFAQRLYHQLKLLADKEHG